MWRPMLAGGLAGKAGGRTPLGLDSYTLRSFRWKALQLLDYAAGLKLDGLQFSIGEFESLEPSHLGKVRERAAQLGVAIEAGIGCVCPTSASWNPKTGDPGAYVVRGLEVASAIGSRSMRCFLGSPAERRRDVPMEVHIESALKVLRPLRSRAQELGVKVAIENHGDLESWEMKSLIEEAGRDWVGCCYDSGNPMAVLEDPLSTLEALAPYVLTSHIRDSVLYEHPRGAAYQWVALGDGSIDLKRLAGRFAELCPGVAWHLEIITGRPPQLLPYLEPEFWKAFPKKPAAEFARFVALARRGHPFMGTMVIGGAKPTAALAEALKEQQRVDFERSIEYARQTLGLGGKA